MSAIEVVQAYYVEDDGLLCLDTVKSGEYSIPMNMYTANKYIKILYEAGMVDLTAFIAAMDYFDWRTAIFSQSKHSPLVL